MINGIDITQESRSLKELPKKYRERQEELEDMQKRLRMPLHYMIVQKTRPDE